MPYIEEIRRREFVMETKGDLEYAIAKLMDEYMMGRPFNYTNLHDCCYAAGHMCDEFRRRFLDKREDYARDKNGDVFTFPLGEDES